MRHGLQLACSTRVKFVLGSALLCVAVLLAYMHHGGATFRKQEQKQQHHHDESGMFSICYVTAPSAAVADTIATVLVTSRLAACVNILPGVKSVYSWKGKIEKDEELLLMIKTQTSLVPQVVTAVKSNHPYDVPEVISVPMGLGSMDYLGWVAASTDQSLPPLTTPLATTAAASDGGISGGASQ